MLEFPRDRLSAIIIDGCYFSRYFLGRQLEIINGFVLIKEFATGSDALKYLSDVSLSAASDPPPNILFFDTELVDSEGNYFLSVLDALVSESAKLATLACYAVASVCDDERCAKVKAFPCVRGVLMKQPSVDDLQAAIKNCY